MTLKEIPPFCDYHKIPKTWTHEYGMERPGEWRCNLCDQEDKDAWNDFMDEDGIPFYAKMSDEEILDDNE